MPLLDFSSSRCKVIFVYLSIPVCCQAGHCFKKESRQFMRFQPTWLLSFVRYSVFLAVYMCGHLSMYAQSSDSTKNNESVKQERNSIAEPSSGKKESPKSCLDYIRQNGKLWGISEVVIDEAAGTVTLVNVRNAGYGYGLTMYDCENKRSLQVILKVNQHCRLSDGHHAFMKYEIKSIKDGIVEVAVTDRFDARSFGKGVTEQTGNVSVKPYKDDDKKTESIGTK